MTFGWVWGRDQVAGLSVLRSFTIELGEKKNFKYGERGREEGGGGGGGRRRGRREGEEGEGGGRERS